MIPSYDKVYLCKTDNTLYRHYLLMGVLSFIHVNKTPGNYLFWTKSIYVTMRADTFVYNVVIARFRIYCNGLFIFWIRPYKTFILLYIFYLFNFFCFLYNLKKDLCFSNLLNFYYFNSNSYYWANLICFKWIFILKYKIKENTLT